LSNARRRSSDGASEGGSPDYKGMATLEKDTIALAAGTVTVALAANAAAMGASSSPEKVFSSTFAANIRAPAKLHLGIPQREIEIEGAKGGRRSGSYGILER
jgi:hypothetical protein